MSEFDSIEKILGEELLELEPCDKLAPKSVMKNLRRKKFLGYARNIAASFLIIAATAAVYLSMNFDGEDVSFKGVAESGEPMQLERVADTPQGGGSAEGELGGYSIDNYADDNTTTDDTTGGEVMDGIAYLGGEANSDEKTSPTEGDDMDLPESNTSYKNPYFIENGIFSDGYINLDIDGGFALDYHVYNPQEIFVFTENGDSLSIYKTDETLTNVEKVVSVDNAKYSYNSKGGNEVYIGFVTTQDEFAKSGIEFTKIDTEGEVSIELLINPDNFEVTIVLLTPFSDTIITTDE